MDEYDDEFKRAWAPDHKMTGEGLFWYKGGWPYEGGGYWFDGLVRLGPGAMPRWARLTTACTEPRQ